MRIIICGANDLAGVYALNAIRHIVRQHETRILLSNNSIPDSVRSPVLREFYQFMGDLTANTFLPLIDQRERIVDERNLLTPIEIEKICNSELRVINGVISDATTRWLVDFHPDIIISIRFPLIFREPLLSLPAFGIYNVHSGVLPAYAGILAPFRAMLNAEKVVGCTIHRVDAGIDTGPLIASRQLTIEPKRSVLWHYCKIYPLGAPVLDELLLRIERGEAAQSQLQDCTFRRYYRYPSEEEISSFLSNGHSFVSTKDYYDLLSDFVRH